MVPCEWINNNWHIHAYIGSFEVGIYSAPLSLHIFFFFCCSLFTVQIHAHMNVQCSCVYRSVLLETIKHERRDTETKSAYERRTLWKQQNVKKVIKRRENEEPIVCAKRISAVLWPANNRHRGGAYHIQFVCCLLFAVFLNEAIIHERIHVCGKLSRILAVLRIVKTNPMKWKKKWRERQSNEAKQ